MPGQLESPGVRHCKQEARSNSDPEAGGRGTEAFQMWEIGAWKGRRERRWCLAANMGGSDFDQRPRAQPLWDHLPFHFMCVIILEIKDGDNPSKLFNGICRGQGGQI